MKISLIRDGDSFKPACEEAEKALIKTRQGDVVLMDFTRHRYVWQHRKFFAMLKLVVDNSDHYKSVDHLRDDIMEATGNFDAKLIRLDTCKWRKLLVRLSDIMAKLGLPIPRFVVLVKLKSMSFASMPQDEFEAFYEEAVKFVLSEVIPGMNRDDLEFEIASSF